MNCKVALPALFLLPLTSFVTTAEEAKAKPEYTASAELGFLYKTGNTKNANIKAGFNVQHEKDKWKTLVDFSILVKKDEIEDDAGNKNFETTDNTWNFLTQTNYTIGKVGKNYLYGSLTHEQDKFSSFESQSSFSAGWGRNWYKTKTSSLFADIGPGVTYDVIRATETTPSENNTNFIIQAQVRYKHQFNDFVKFEQYFIAKQATQSGENSVYKSETSISAKLIDALQLKFAIRIDYDTEVEEGFENTNSETSMTLIYSF